MTPIDRFERQLPVALTDLAAPRTPDYLTDILGRTARTRQRPAWASIERWLPMQLTTTRVITTRMPWRQVGVLAIIAILLAAMLAVYIGSQQRKLPPPFGQAGNGSVAFAKGGDIYVTDPRTGTNRILISGPEQDDHPMYSLDGTHLLFGRTIGGDQTKVTLFMSRDDGSGLVQLTEPLRNASDWSFAPDGRAVATFAFTDQGKAIVVVPTDGSRAANVFPVFATTDDGPPRYRPDGSEIMFIGLERSQTFRGVYALSVADGRVRAVVPPFPNLDIHGASWSPDGKHVAYGAYDPSAQMSTARSHVIGVDGAGDVEVDADPRSVASSGDVWSNDSTRLVIGRFLSEDGSIPLRSVVVPIDRSSTGVEIACRPAAPADDCGADWNWSPDDSMLFATVPTAAGEIEILADPRTGEIRTAPWSASAQAAWQRVAP